MPATFPMPTGAFTVEQPPDPGPKRERYTFAKISDVLEIPNLIELQKASFDWFKTEGLADAFASISPIKDFTGNLILEFGEHSLGEPKYTIEECRERDMTYSAPLRVRVRLITAESGEIKGIPDQEIFMGDFPLMTDKGTFMINGAERVIVSQLVRSPGVYYMQDADTNARPTFNATIIPNRGAWIEFETDNDTEAACRYFEWRLREGDDLTTAVQRGFSVLDGFYTFLMGTDTELLIVRDAFACKPAVVAETDEYVAIASEFRSLAHLPDIANAELFEPKPEEIYRWRI